MDRPYDDSETLGMTDVDDGTPIPKGMGAGATSGADKSSQARASDKPPSSSETFAAGDQAAAGANEPRWLGDLRVLARREPVATVAVAAALGIVLGIAITR